MKWRYPTSATTITSTLLSLSSTTWKWVFAVIKWGSCVIQIFSTLYIILWLLLSFTAVERRYLDLSCTYVSTCGTFQCQSIRDSLSQDMMELWCFVIQYIPSCVCYRFLDTCNLFEKIDKSERYWNCEIGYLSIVLK